MRILRTFIGNKWSENNVLSESDFQEGQVKRNRAEPPPPQFLFNFQCTALNNEARKYVTIAHIVGSNIRQMFWQMQQ